MIEALALLVFAALVATVGASALSRAEWPQMAPRLGVAAWQVLTGSAVAATVLAGLSLTVPQAAISANIAELLHACVMALRRQYATPGGALIHATGAVLTVFLLGRLTYLLGSGLGRARRLRHRHLDQLSLLSHRDPDLGALIVDHPTATAYCLPGRAHTIVLTSAAVAALDGDELAAVLAHERAHLHGRHHLVLALAEALSRTLPWVPCFGLARDEQARLLEMLADDRASRPSGRLTVARALVNLAEGSVPAAALGAGDVCAVARVRRLIEPAHTLGIGRRAAIGGILVLTAALPIGLASAPAIAATNSQYCPITADLRSS